MKKGTYDELCKIATHSHVSIDELTVIWEQFIESGVSATKAMENLGLAYDGLSEDLRRFRARKKSKKLVRIIR